jgi:hypothetical protein
MAARRAGANLWASVLYAPEFCGIEGLKQSAAGRFSQPKAGKRAGREAVSPSSDTIWTKQ